MTDGEGDAVLTIEELAAETRAGIMAILRETWNVYRSCNQESVRLGCVNSLRTTYATYVDLMQRLGIIEESPELQSFRKIQLMSHMQLDEFVNADGAEMMRILADFDRRN